MVIRKRLQLVGPAVVFITTTIKDWTPIFISDVAALTAIAELKYSLGLYSVSICGYVLMPSHLHAILYFNEIERLSKFVQCFKGNCSKAVRDLESAPFKETFFQKEGFQLWKPRFDDFIIRNDEQFRIKLNYIHENPVRSGLVNDAIDYKYSSAKDWLVGEKGLIDINKEPLY